MKKRGIADYLDDLPKIKDILLPLLKKVSEYIPTQVDIDETVLFIRATGGMRSLSTDDQSALWSAVVGMLEDDPTTPFHINPHNFGTISGKLEAYYAVIAANYVAGRVDSNLIPIPGQKMIGALDMGGSSTQMIYHVGDKANEDDFWYVEFVDDY